MTAPSYSLVVTRLRAAGCVFAEDEARLLLAAARTPAELTELVEGRVAGLPLEHLLGWAEFCGVRIHVDAGVFVPRRRTELLAREASAGARAGAVVVDMCCGSGAVGAVVAAGGSGVELHAVDIDPVAVRCARRNVPGAVHEGDLFEPLPARLRGRVDVIVANAPYVPTDAIRFMPLEARAHEPAVALDGGVDGLAVQRRVIAEAPEWLGPWGQLLVETSQQQAPLTVDAFAVAGLVPRVVRCGELDATVVVGSR
jgi:release factor glutamine methyltransferase